jgi:hypothetical protein
MNGRFLTPVEYNSSKDHRDVNALKDHYRGGNDTEMNGGRDFVSPTSIRTDGNAISFCGEPTYLRKPPRFDIGQRIPLEGQPPKGYRDIGVTHPNNIAYVPKGPNGPNDKFWYENYDKKHVDFRPGLNVIEACYLRDGDIMKLNEGITHTKYDKSGCKVIRSTAWERGVGIEDSDLLLKGVSEGPQGLMPCILPNHTEGNAPAGKVVSERNLSLQRLQEAPRSLQPCIKPNYTIGNVPAGKITSERNLSLQGLQEAPKSLQTCITPNRNVGNVITDQIVSDRPAIDRNVGVVVPAGTSQCRQSSRGPPTDPNRELRERLGGVL